MRVFTLELRVVILKLVLELKLVRSALRANVVPPVVMPSCTTTVTRLVSTNSSPGAPSMVLSDVVVPLRCCTILVIFYPYAAGLITNVPATFTMLVPVLLVAMPAVPPGLEPAPVQ